MNFSAITCVLLTLIVACQALANPTSKPSTSAKETNKQFGDDPDFFETRINIPPDKTVTIHKAKHCKRSTCKLPNCFCGGRVIPGDLSPEKIPQIILLTFDDAVNAINWELFTVLFNGKRINPNGCPISATFYLSHEWTDYSKVNALFSSGHEIASHSISHKDGAKFDAARWWREIEGQREFISELAEIPLQEIRGMRAPFLQPGGNNQFAMLHAANFSYDATLTIVDPSMWPYTVDYALSHRCLLEPCPNASFPGIWEVPLAMIRGSNGHTCPMADSCYYSATVPGVKRTFMKNFEAHYNGNRAPLGLYFHYAYFSQPHHRAGFIEFVDEILKLNDVYFVTTWQALEWIRRPTSLSDILTFTPWNCRKLRAHTDLNCVNPKACFLRLKGQERVLNVCGKCPKHYPWLDNFPGN